MNLDAANLPAGAVNLTVGAVNPANQAILPMAPALVLIDRHIRTFSQLYGDENKDLCNQN